MPQRSSAQPPHTPSPTPANNDQLEIGPGARIAIVEADPAGGLVYQFENHVMRSFCLPLACAHQRYGVIDLPSAALVMNPRNHRLQALAFFGPMGTSVLLFANDWGRWIDPKGRMHAAPDILHLFEQWSVPVLVDAKRHLITVEFVINPWIRGGYTEDLTCFFNDTPGMRHTLSFIFRYPLGTLQATRLRVHEIKSGRMAVMQEIESFPLRWPRRLFATAPPPPNPEPTPEPVPPQTEAATDGPQNGHRTAPSQAAASPGQYAKVLHTGEQPQPAPPAPEPPDTSNLTTAELLERIAGEPDAAIRWAIIEKNLRLGRPERTYPLLSRFSDSIDEKVRRWSPESLRKTFAAQPAAVLIGLMHHWKINQVLAVAEQNAESTQIIDWLRTREIDRLLNLELLREPATPDAARRVLNLTPTADEAAVRKAWRTLMGFLNVDHGRAAEQAIHRKKDEIAKHLQVARHTLLG